MSKVLVWQWKHGVWVHERKVGGREGQGGEYYGQLALSRIDNFFHERTCRDPS